MTPATENPAPSSGLCGYNVCVCVCVHIYTCTNTCNHKQTNNKHFNMVKMRNTTVDEIEHQLDEGEEMEGLEKESCVVMFSLEVALRIGETLWVTSGMSD